MTTGDLWGLRPLLCFENVAYEPVVNFMDEQWVGFKPKPIAKRFRLCNTVLQYGDRESRSSTLHCANTGLSTQALPRLHLTV